MISLNIWTVVLNTRGKFWTVTCERKEVTKDLVVSKWHNQGSILERITLSKYAECTLERKMIQRGKKPVQDWGKTNINYCC